MMGMGAPMPGPDGGLYLPVLTGDGNPASEVLWSCEIGWRLQPNSRVNLDIATFYNRYSGIIGVGAVPEFIPGSPLGLAKMPFENVAGSDAWGGEATLTVSPTSHWRLSLSHSVLFINDGGPGPGFRFDPSNQTVLRSSHDLGAKLTLDLQLRHVGSFQSTDFVTTSTLPAYTEADARLAYHPAPAVELSLSGRNLLHRQHPEQGYAPYAITSQVPRRVQADITFRF
jgi:iron complex outermembrane receptor protein